MSVELSQTSDASGGAMWTPHNQNAHDSHAETPVEAHTRPTTGANPYSDRIGPSKPIQQPEVRLYHSTNGILSGLPKQRARVNRSKGTKFNMMLVGESGTGKSRFINMLFHTGNGAIQGHDPSSGRAGAFGGDIVPATMAGPQHTSLTSQKVTYVPDGFAIDVTILESVGFGDFTDNSFAWVPLTNYIDDQASLYMIQEEQPDRRLLADNRVHVCIYFISPTSYGLMPLDVLAMKELGHRVNLIPVISRSDSLTSSELDQMRRRIRESIEKHRIEVFTPSTDTLASFPYAFAWGDELVRDHNGGSHWMKQYSWGTLNVEDPQFTDFAALRETLLGVSLMELIQLTHWQHYGRHREAMVMLRIKYAQEKLQAQAQARSRNQSGSANDNSAGTQDTQNSHSGSSGDTYGQRLDPEIFRPIQSMSSVEILGLISQFGWSFIQNRRLEDDELFHQQRDRLTKNYTADAEQERHRIKVWKEKLQMQEEYLQAERDEITKELKYLDAEILRLSTRAK